MLGRLLIAVVGLTLALGTTAFADDPADGEVVTVTAKYVFAPTGFDDNDRVEVVIDGYLPNGCYRLTQAEVAIDPATNTIDITPKARYFDVPCIEALVPYSETVTVGTLPMGDYTVNLETSRLSRELTVAESNNSGPDDFLYAPVDGAVVEKLASSTRLIGIMEGRFTNSCMSWDDVDVLFDGASVIVLPKIEVEDRPDCVDGEYPFKRTFLMPEGLDTGRYLLHIRSLNGKAVNRVFSVAN